MGGPAVNEVGLAVLAQRAADDAAFGEDRATPEELVAEVNDSAVEEIERRNSAWVGHTWWQDYPTTNLELSDMSPVVVKATQPTADDYGAAAIPVGAVWITPP
jgi:hypothetical protein